MSINLDKKYFLMSYRFNKTKPKDFLLIPSKELDVFIMPSDNSLWKKCNLYDFGWGKENGFMRLPKLGFKDLWYLLTESKINENRHGAASIIGDEYANELKKHVIDFFNKAHTKNDLIIEALKLLKLNQPINRSDTIGKKYDEVKKDFDTWKYISNKVSNYIEE